ncbi:uncharacterized MFS-type transporter C09D4.1-like [Chrysoperla carnea]|uniref:uncharacterized MFS-type transporter C09D4.1-like n=1 Tax=Chrysoperla carnea TaxID=189513 RepID=UPI001D079072|nr:uncharacterized MFS-type transporter C09D4.1-like [Chrysoperla carnea]
MTVRKTSFAVSEKSKPETYRVYKRRWLMIFIFAAIYFINSAHWVQYTIIADTIKKFYNVDTTMVNMTSVVYLVPYLPLILPASYLIDKKGVRFTLLLAAIGNFFGSWLKVFSAHPNGFYIGLTGQTILAISQLFILSLPPKLAGIWFDKHQMSTACTIGVFGTQLGIATSFFLTPIVVQDHDNLDSIGDDLYRLFIFMAIYTTVNLIITILFFQEEPPTPPSEAQKLKKQENSNPIESFKKLLTNQPFVMLLCAYSINIGIYNTINTLLNPILVEHFKINGAQFAGRIGVVFVASGTFSSVVFGMILDRTKKFKEVTAVVYFMSVVGMLAFTFAVISENKLFIYLSALMFGTFVSGYLVVGYETGVELTYPESEFNSSGLLIGVSSMAGVIFTFLFTYILETTSDFWANMGMAMLLMVGTVLTLFTRNVRKRQEALDPSKLKQHIEKNTEKF